jgi:SH3 domain-containing protein 21
VFLLSPDSSPIKDTQPKPDRPPPSAKMLVNKSPNTTNSFRKDSFGSRDSLNDTFSGLSTSVVSAFTNVAAQRKSLEHRNLDLTLTPADKPPKKGGLDIKSDLRKSIENLDEKKSSQPPPVLGKKPSVPIKKSPSITNPTGLLAGLKNKIKGSGGDSKLSSSDSLDGGASSRLSIGVSSGGIADNSEKGKHKIFQK